MKKASLTLLLALLCLNMKAQVIGEFNVLDRDVFALKYTPKNDFSNNINYQKLSTNLSLPPFKMDKLFLFNTLGIDVHEFNYRNNISVINTTEMERFFNINYSLFMHYKFSDKWTLNALASGFTLTNFEGNFSIKDVDFNGNVFIERTYLRKKGGYIQIGLGAGYLTLNGTTRINPVTHIKARLNEDWSFVLGLPNTYVKWDINKRHSIKALGDLNDFSAHLNSSNIIIHNQKPERAVFTTISAGLEYNFWITPSLGLMLKGTYPVWGDYEIRNGKNESLYNFDTSFEQPFIGIGIKFNPIRNLQNSLKPL